MGVYIYDTMEKVPFEILNIIGLKTSNCSVGEFSFAYWYLKAYYVNIISYLCVYYYAVGKLCYILFIVLFLLIDLVSENIEALKPLL